jgi:hypothetical protein
MPHLDACEPCTDQCELVFDRVVVSHLIQGPTRVMWELTDTFTEPGPFEFQLQAGKTANPDADDWEDVGLPVVDQYFALDADQRVWGKLDWTHYRVALTTPAGTHVSAPVGGMGVLDRRDWRLARDMVRQRKVAFRVGPGGQKGYLLKRRWAGADCPVCLDHQTKEVRNPDCPDCFGTGKKCGYYYPMSCVFAELDPKTRHTHLDRQRGTVDDIAVRSTMLMTELLGEMDVFVADRTDDRYYVHEVQHTAEMRGVPIVASVSLRPIPFSSPIYGIAIPDQLRTHGLE